MVPPQMPYTRSCSSVCSGLGDEWAAGAPGPGAPVWVVVPGYIGARSVKCVEPITVQAQPSDSYFQATAYRLLPADADPSAPGSGDGLALGPVAVQVDILTPASTAVSTAAEAAKIAADLIRQAQGTRP